MTEQQIIDAMANHGMRITEQRKTLAKLFADTQKSLSAKEIYEHMEKKYSGLSFDTVYRNVRTLHELGIIEQFQLDDGVRFKLRCTSGTHHHHLICLECETTVSIDYCPLDELQQWPDSFQVVQHKFELYGYCKNCK